MLYKHDIFHPHKYLWEEVILILLHRRKPEQSEVYKLLKVTQ